MTLPSFLRREPRLTPLSREVQILGALWPSDRRGLSGRRVGMTRGAIYAASGSVIFARTPGRMVTSCRGDSPTKR